MRAAREFDATAVNFGHVVLRLMKGLDMDTNRLRYFVEVAGTLHFGKAAAQLGITQPTLSQQIQTLESEVGVRLLNRSASGVTLTPAGQALLPRAEMILAEIRSAGEFARLASLQVGGVLRVGNLQCDVPDHARRLLDRFQQAYPGVHVETVLEGTGDRLADLRKGRLDAAILRMDRLEGENILFRPLYVEPLVLAVAADSPLVAMPRIELTDLRGENLAYFFRAQNPYLYDTVHDTLAAADVDLPIIREAWNEISILPSIASGHAVSFFAKSKAAVLHYRNVAYRSLDVPALKIGLGLAVRADVDCSSARALWNLSQADDEENRVEVAFGA